VNRSKNRKVAGFIHEPRNGVSGTLPRRQGSVHGLAVSRSVATVTF
jgi:hypothetical protein